MTTELTELQMDELLELYLGTEAGDLNLSSAARRKADDGKVTVVTDVAGAQEAFRELRSEKALAVDCEASGGMHRYGRLCLLQIGTVEGRCWLIDLVAEFPAAAATTTTTETVDDDNDRQDHQRCSLGAEVIEPLRPLLENPAILKVMHDCRGDSDLLFHAFGIELQNVVDTQVMYALQQRSEGSLMPLPVSLRTLHIKNNFAVFAETKDLARDEMTDSYWLIRPMTPLMLTYAAHDVQFLLRIFNSIKSTFSADSMAIIKTCSEQYVRQYRDIAHEKRRAAIAEEETRDPSVRFVPLYNIDEWDFLASRELRADPQGVYSTFGAQHAVVKRDARDSVDEPSPRSKFTRFL